MTVYYNQMFYLGQFADMDTNEADYAVESPNDVLGTYAQPSLINVAVHDADNDGVIKDADAGRTQLESLDFDVGAGTQSSAIDSTITYNVRVTLGDNSTVDMIATAIQMQSGHVFLTDYGNFGDLDNLNIKSIELLSLDDSDYSGFFANSSVDNSNVVCFGSGTRISTPSGGRAVETLRAGDQVLTADHGVQPLLGVISNPVPHHAKDQPVVITAGALGPGVPARDLRLSPQHRVLAVGPIVQRMFGATEVFVTAKALLQAGIVVQQPARPTERYWHLICARHEIVFAEGCATETLLSGPQAVASLNKTPVGAQAAAQLSILCDEAARPTPQMARQTQLVRRSVSNRKPLQLPQAAMAASRQSLTVV